jgi:hypothetical protein
MKSLALLAILVLLAPSCGAQAEPATVVSQKQDAQITLQSTPQQLLVDVRSSAGIGDATIRLAPGAKPAKIILRFHLAGLEAMSFRYGQTAVSVSIASSGDHRTLESVSSGGDAAGSRPIASSSPFWMPVTIVSKDNAYPIQDGYVDVEAPRDFLAGSERQFSFEWVDFYR